VGASNGKGVNYVSPNDCADVAVHCLLAPKDHRRIGYTLTGPAPIKDAEIAELLSKKLNKTVKYEDLTLQDFCKDVKATEWGPALDVAYLEQVKATGAEERLGFVTHDIEKVCGRPAETMEQYLMDQDSMTPAEIEYLKPVSNAQEYDA